MDHWEDLVELPTARRSWLRTLVEDALWLLPLVTLLLLGGWIAVEMAIRLWQWVGIDAAR